jgi:hypothetical protein
MWVQIEQGRLNKSPEAFARVDEEEFLRRLIGLTLVHDRYDRTPLRDVLSSPDKKPPV